jgi:thioredoxin reductase (NADPH)
METGINHYACVIIGSGPAGYTAAIYAARAGLKPVLFCGPQIGGQLTTTTEVDNFPGYPDGIQGPEMMEQFRKQAARFGTDIRYSSVTAADFLGSVHTLTIDGNQTITADAVIISTGATAKWLGLPGEQEYNGRGVSACAVCDGFFYRGQVVAVVGGGDTAAEEASYLAKLCTKVYLLVRGNAMRASKIMAHRVENTPNIEILYNTQTAEILGDANGVSGIVTKDTITGATNKLDVTGFFVAIGHQPNTSIFKGQIDMDAQEYIVTKPNTTQTNIAGVFACGDVQDNVYRQAVTAAGTGCMAALDAERYLAEKETA